MIKGWLLVFSYDFFVTYTDSLFSFHDNRWRKCKRCSEVEQRNSNIHTWHNDFILFFYLEISVSIVCWWYSCLFCLAVTLHIDVHQRALFCPCRRKTSKTPISKSDISIWSVPATSYPPFHSGSTVNFYSQGKRKTAVVEKENIKVSFSGDVLASVVSQTLVP